MSESWCAALLVALVPLVTGLNAALLYQVKGLQEQMSHVERRKDVVARGSVDG